MLDPGRTYSSWARTAAPADNGRVKSRTRVKLMISVYALDGNANLQRAGVSASQPWPMLSQQPGHLSFANSEDRQIDDTNPTIAERRTDIFAGASSRILRYGAVSVCLLFERLGSRAMMEVMA
jgi:hypothetical protein